MVTLATMLAQLGPHQPYGVAHDDDQEITGVTADSRLVRLGDLFVAIRGAQVDGHRFLRAAAENGASALLGELSPTELADSGLDVPDTIPYIRVADSRGALAHCASILYDFPSQHLTVVGITGTDGKTTTCTILESILAVATRSRDYPAGRVGVITTVGARIMGDVLDTGLHVTTPDAPQVQGYLAAMVTAGCTYAIVESTSHGLDQGRVDAVEFDVAAVTNITHEHLDYHGSRAAYVNAKATLFRKLAEIGRTKRNPRLAVLNVDDDGSFEALHMALDEAVAKVHPYNKLDNTKLSDGACCQHSQAIVRRSYGLGQVSEPRAAEQIDVVARDIIYAPGRTDFVLSWWAGEFEVSSDLIGEFNVSNLLCAATIALGLAITPKSVQIGIAEMRGVIGRMERIDCGQPFLALVDFAHSPVSLERALSTLRPLVGNDEEGRVGRLIAIFGCAGLRDVEKRKLMGRASGRLADFTVVTAEDPRTEDLDAINRAISAGLLETTSSDCFVVIPDRSQAIHYAVAMARRGDVVAAFGKGHERSICFGTTEYPWSDQATMAKALQQHKTQ